MRHLLAISCAILLLACQAVEKPAMPNSETLKNSTDFNFKTAFKDQFLVGTALSRDQMFKDEKILDFVSQQFNAVTAENEMKWERIHPEPNVYTWDFSDALVKFSMKHDIFITGHTLVWHQQIPSWVFQDNDGHDSKGKDDKGKEVSPAMLRERLTQHIQAVVGRYRGKIQSWDVVNEALNDDGSYRESQWYKILGPEYIELAFKLAHEIDPKAKLYYNDYNLWKPEKRDGVIRLVKNLQKKGIAIHGIGMQGHYGLDHPANLQLIEDAITAYAQLGVDVMVTELDLTTLPFPDAENQGADISLNIELKQKYNPYPNGLSNEALQAFENRYRDIFKLFLKNSDKLQRVTFWGVHDGQSWRNNWPIKGRTDYPLLVDRNLEVKPIAKKLIGLEK